MQQQFTSWRAFGAFAAEIAPERRIVESYFDRSDRITGYCPVCEAVTSFEHRRPSDGGWSDLRENIVCSCGLNGRARMLFEALRRAILELSPQSEVLFFEQVTPLFRCLSKKYSRIQGCEYMGADCVSGEIVEWHGTKVRHEDLQAISAADGSIDLLYHGDVLEHVPDWEAALLENLRALRPGGQLIFTTPCFDLVNHKKRAEYRNGKLTHLEPAAYHGNPIDQSGALVFTEFSTKLVDDLTRLGFVDSKIVCVFEPFKGIVSNYNPYKEGFMLPVYFKARKPGQKS